MKYKLTQRDTTLEFLAFPTLKQLPIERRNFVEFAEFLKILVFETFQKTEEKPKNYYYSGFLLSKVIF